MWKFNIAFLKGNGPAKLSIANQNTQDISGQVVGLVRRVDYGHSLLEVYCGSRGVIFRLIRMLYAQQREVLDLYRYLVSS